MHEDARQVQLDLEADVHVRAVDGGRPPQREPPVGDLVETAPLRVRQLLVLCARQTRCSVAVPAYGSTRQPYVFLVKAGPSVTTALVYSARMRSIMLTVAAVDMSRRALMDSSKPEAFSQNRPSQVGK